VSYENASDLGYVCNKMSKTDKPIEMKGNNPWIKTCKYFFNVQLRPNFKMMNAKDKDQENTRPKLLLVRFSSRHQLFYHQMLYTIHKEFDSGSSFK
jgi:hypothetical protein